MEASVPVNSPFTLEELVHMIDVSVNSKYGADLEGITRTIMDGMRGTIESLCQEFKQERDNLPRQIRATVQQVLGEARDKWVFDAPSASAASVEVDVGNTLGGAQINRSMTPSWVGMGNLILQQPYYQAHAYRPKALQLVPNAYFPRPPIFPTVIGHIQPGISESMREQVARMLREFGLEPKSRVRAYQKSYPEFFNTVPYPRGVQVSDFAKFTREDSKTTYKHIVQFLVQVNDFGVMDVHIIRLFPLSLSGMMFNWFVSLPPNSVDTWDWLEQKFHDYFYNGESELRFSHLVSVKQKSNEVVVDYMRRFRDTHNKCYGLSPGEKDLAEFAFAFCKVVHRIEGQDFSYVNQVLQRAVGYES
jgi:hypothetical protein